jgi:hypothetical protein
MMEYEGQLSEIIANLLISKISQSSPKKRARALKSNNQSNSSPSAEQVSFSFYSIFDHMNFLILYSLYLVVKSLGAFKKVLFLC